jgi:hypothetical protein
MLVLNAKNRTKEHLDRKIQKRNPKSGVFTTFRVLVGEDGFEPSKRYAADLQSAKSARASRIFFILTTLLTTF